MFRHFICLLLAFFVVELSAQDKVVSAKSTSFALAAPISDHMVLQQGKATSIWGTGPANSIVSVEFAGQTATGKANADGHWEVKLRALETSATPQMLKVSCGDEAIEVNDILVGEVWMCSGQSNMAFTLGRMTSVEPYKNVLSESDLPHIRYFNTASQTAKVPQRDCSGEWKLMSPETAAQCSAAGYYFGRQLHEKLDVPIGLVVTAWGGKPVEAFTSYEKLTSIPDAGPLLEEWDGMSAKYSAEKAQAKYEAALEAWNKKRAEITAASKDGGKKPRLPRKPTKQGQPVLDSNYPGAIYNQKIAPWQNYAVAGAIWYQGEANRARATQYRSLLTALIEDWRARWEDDFSFYIVQLASFQPASTEPGTPNAWAELQDSQTFVSQSVPKCGIAIANDIGEEKDIHPKNKRDVGLRLARLALKHDYVQDIEPYSSPLLKTHQISGNSIVVSFDHVGQGLKSKDDQPLQRFEIAGKDRVWHWAQAKITAPNQVTVSSPNVSQPVAVRYAWASNPTGANLVNSADLPASLFRTDDWPLSTDGVFTRSSIDHQKVLEATQKQMQKQGYVPLFNGQDLSGWRNPYDHGSAKVVNGEIHLTANKKFFLVTEKKFSDFRLIAEIRLPEGEANSGVMFRCHVQPNKVFGYQAECDGSDRRWSAGLFDEGRRKWVWPSTSGRSEKEFLKYEEESKAHFAKPEVRDALKRNDWNRYVIQCRGDRISIQLNGVKVTNLRDATDAEGYIGIQHHGEEGQTYRFRNLFIKELVDE